MRRRHRAPGLIFPQLSAFIFQNEETEKERQRSILRIGGEPAAQSPRQKSKADYIASFSLVGEEVARRNKGKPRVGKEKKAGTIQS